MYRASKIFKWQNIIRIPSNYLLYIFKFYRNNCSISGTTLSHLTPNSEPIASNVCTINGPHKVQKVLTICNIQFWVGKCQLLSIITHHTYIIILIFRSDKIKNKTKENRSASEWRKVTFLSQALLSNWCSLYFHWQPLFLETSLWGQDCTRLNGLTRNLPGSQRNGGTFWTVVSLQGNCCYLS